MIIDFEEVSMKQKQQQQQKYAKSKVTLVFLLKTNQIISYSLILRFSVWPQTYTHAYIIA